MNKNHIRGVEISRHGQNRVPDPHTGKTAKRTCLVIAGSYFHPDSYGYRAGKSAHQAIAKTRERCWHMDWVIDLDIKGFFDNLEHGLIMKALRRHTDEDWIHLYVRRWLEAPEAAAGNLGEKLISLNAVDHPNGTITTKTEHFLKAKRGRGQKKHPGWKAMKLCQNLSGSLLKTIAKYFGMKTYATVSITIARLKQEMEVNRMLVDDYNGISIDITPSCTIVLLI